MTDEQMRQFLSPKPEDYIMVPMRALSATGVQGDTINFGHNDGAALKEAVNLFNGLIVLKDHDQTVDKWVGQTQDAYWDTSIPNIPPGVNFMLKVDTKADPKLARGLISGMITSGSVTIQFDYDKSHPDMKDFDFYMQMGTTVKGKLVQALVTKVTRCYEYSLVWQGADSNAKTVNPDGTIDKPGLALHTPEVTMKKLALSLGLPETATEDEINTALQAKLAAETAATALVTAAQTQVTALTATLAAKETELNAKVVEITVLTAKATTLEAEKTTLSTENTSLKADKAAFDAHLTARRAEALRLYKLDAGEKAIPAMETTINASPLDTVESFVTSFSASVDKSMPISCTKCGSSELSRRASKQSETTEETGTVSPLAAAKAAGLKATLASIHGK
jgi:hypothetical protein